MPDQFLRTSPSKLHWLGRPKMLKGSLTGDNQIVFVLDVNWKLHILVIVMTFEDALLHNRIESCLPITTEMYAREP